MININEVSKEKIKSALRKQEAMYPIWRADGVGRETNYCRECGFGIDNMRNYCSNCGQRFI